MSQEGKWRKREEAIGALLSSPSIEAAARKCAVTKRTLLRWLADESFRSEYQEARRRLLRAATARLSKNAFRAACALERIFSSKPRAFQGARVSAAIGTLRLAIEADVVEDLEARIRRLEGQSDSL